MSNCTFAYTAPAFCIPGHLELGSQGAGFFFSAELDICTKDPEKYRGIVNTRITSWHTVTSTWSESGLGSQDCCGSVEHSTSPCKQGWGLSGLCFLLPALPKPRWSGTAWVTPLLWIWPKLSSFCTVSTLQWTLFFYVGWQRLSKAQWICFSVALPWLYHFWDSVAV